ELHVTTLPRFVTTHVRVTRRQPGEFRGGADRYGACERARSEEPTMIDNDDRKLNGNFVWLFAAAALGAAIVAPKLVHGVTTVKAMSGIFGAIFAAFGIASTLLARTGGWRAAGAFLLAGAGHAIYWFVTVRSATSGSGEGVAALGTGVGMILTLA